jgi:hypothetical protein
MASDSSAFPQGSIQQLTIYSNPRTPEELCEAQESSVSTLPHGGPVAPQWSAWECWGAQ